MAEYKLYHGDCLKIMPVLKTKIDAIITDPPWGINGATGGRNKKRGKGLYESPFEDTAEYIKTVVINALSLMLDMSDCVILTPGYKNMMLYPQPDSFGCFYQPAAAGMQTFGFMDASPIFYYGKNATKKNMGKKCSFVMTSNDNQIPHPCPKPEKEWTELLLNHTLKGQTVLDPFMGSGTTGVVCAKTGRNFIGIELGDSYFHYASNRIKKSFSDLPMPFDLGDGKKQLALF